MIIAVDHTIREKYMDGFIRPSRPTEIVIHGTGGGASASALLTWMRSGERAKEYTRGVALFHYIIDFDGDTTEIISPDNWVYHSSSGAHDQSTIGIELMNKSSDNSDPYKREQYESLFDLISQLMDRYTIKTICGHGYNKRKYSGSDKRCPGNFDWHNLGDYLMAEKYNVKFAPEYFEITGA
jgi:N-acetyl-anhydromuramyl-L-alanine amidase AmpD